MSLREAETLIGEHDYPATSDELVEAFGSHEIDLPDGTETLGEVLSRDGEESYRSREEAVFALYAGVGREAVGRPGYSDRDGAPMGTSGPRPVSF